MEKSEFGGTARGNAQRQASLVGWSNSILDGADGLQEERIKDGGSGWVAKDHQCCHESSATLIVMDTADVVRAGDQKSLCFTKGPPFIKRTHLKARCIELTLHGFQ